jgi:protein-ribulosamine 3-kinase
MDFSSIINKKVISSSLLSGGCIGKSYRVRTTDCEYFVKYYPKAGISEVEAHGIKELAESQTVKVPELINFDDHYLVFEFITQKPKTADFQKKLGKDLARLHKSGNSQYGFYEDNYIGSTVQKNAYNEHWINFYMENRLDYQVTLSKDKDIFKNYEILRIKIQEILDGSLETPCLIHGDLWSGNVISDEKGDPVLIDPAAYYGNRELELAMTQLFGGFTAEFYNSYNEEFPLKKNWKYRQDLYKLYHILNHLNIFGQSYKYQALELMKSYM